MSKFSSKGRLTFFSSCAFFSNIIALGIFTVYSYSIPRYPLFLPNKVKLLKLGLYWTVHLKRKIIGCEYFLGPAVLVDTRNYMATNLAT